MAVTTVFWPLITITGRLGRSSLIIGRSSKPFVLGIITSVITRSPNPCLIHSSNCSPLLVDLVDKPNLCNFFSITVLIASSSSAIKIKLLLIFITLIRWKQYRKNCLSTTTINLYYTSMLINNISY